MSNILYLDPGQNLDLLKAPLKCPACQCDGPFTSKVGGGTICPGCDAELWLTLARRK